MLNAKESLYYCFKKLSLWPGNPCGFFHLKSLARTRKSDLEALSVFAIDLKSTYQTSWKSKRKIRFANSCGSNCLQQNRHFFHFFTFLQSLTLFQSWSTRSTEFWARQIDCWVCHRPMSHLLWLSRDWIASCYWFSSKTKQRKIAEHLKPTACNQSWWKSSTSQLRKNCRLF